MGPRKLRVLFLHGFRTNVQVMQDQTRGLRAALGDAAEYVFLNGPFEADGPSDSDIEQRYAESKPFYEWWRVAFHDGRDFDSSVNDAESTAKLRRDADPDVDHDWSLLYEGLDQTLEYIDEQLRAHGPFDVVVGFSQGAILLSVLTMWYLQHQNVTWWKLAICVCGVPVTGINVRALFVDEQGREMLVPLPSIHLIGQKDPLFVESHALTRMWADHAENAAFPKVVLEHDSGHKFPSYNERNHALYAELVRLINLQCRRGEVDVPPARL
jgi:hypothetical protein